MKTTDARLALRALAAKATLAAALTTCLSVTAWAQPSQPPTTPELTSLIGRLQALYPSTRFGEIRPTPWPGVFEVAMGANLAYVDASGQYFLFGHLYDMKAQRDLTAERKDTLARIDFNALPLADAIKDVRGRGSRALAIFSDPQTIIRDVSLKPGLNIIWTPDMSSSGSRADSSAGTSSAARSRWATRSRQRFDFSRTRARPSRASTDAGSGAVRSNAKP